MAESETVADRFADATPRPWANADGIVFAVRTQTNHNTFEQPAVAVCQPVQVMAAFVDAQRYDVDAEAVHRTNAELIVAAVNAYHPLWKLAQTSLDLLNDVYNSRASQRFSAIGLSRIQSHIKELSELLNPSPAGKEMQGK